MTPGPLIDSRVAAFLPPPTVRNLRLAARIACALGFEYLCWVYLMECEVRK